ncbi:MAG: ImmA/IrrE family metallo-endopeptidase [Prolixibacteraceae bacterium]|nr:ImmA/IrrE family metallo-endopeptidase [Prolixibacteraceae bacterium]
MNRNRQLTIERTAESVRVECGISDYGFTDIFEALEKSKYRCIRYPIGSEAFLGFAMLKDSERIVFTNSSQILSREIFTAAHELGHHRLHLSEFGRTLIKDDDFGEKNELEIEANYFAACLLMPADKTERFTRFELNLKDPLCWDGFDIARIQTAFNVSYDMALVRLKSLGYISDSVSDKLKMDKNQRTASRLLRVIGGNVDLCKAADVKKVPAEFLEWVIENYNEKLIPKQSLEKALSYLDLQADDFVSNGCNEDGLPEGTN